METLQEWIAREMDRITQDSDREQYTSELSVLKKEVLEKQRVFEEPAKIIALAVMKVVGARHDPSRERCWIYRPCGTQVRGKRLAYQRGMHFTEEDMNAFIEACEQTDMAPLYRDSAMVMLHHAPVIPRMPRFKNFLGEDGWPLSWVTGFFEGLNKRYGLQVEIDLQVEEKGRFPVYRRGGKLIFVPSFFNHKDISDSIRTMLLVEMYCVCYLDRRKTGEVDVSPDFMAKGICEDAAYRYMPYAEMETQLRGVRRSLYDDAEYVSYFCIGEKLRESAFASYEVTGITRKNGGVEVTVKPIGARLGEPERCFSEEELFVRCCIGGDISEETVSMRRNLFVVSGASGVGKDSVVAELLRQCPGLVKTISLTTRAPREGEADGREYYFVDDKTFDTYVAQGRVLESERYGDCRYGTLFSEIEKHPADTPILLVIDVRGRRSVLRQYPMARTVFVEPPSLEELKNRLISRGKNTQQEIEYRLRRAEEELKEKRWYDLVVENEELARCVQEIRSYVTDVIGT